MKTIFLDDLQRIRFLGDFVRHEKDGAMPAFSEVLDSSEVVNAEDSRRGFIDLRGSRRED